MIDYIIITTNINIIEALQIRNYGKFENPIYHANGMKSYELKDCGIREIAVWADTKKIFMEHSSSRNCLFSATIDATMFLKEGVNNYKEIIERIEAYLPPSFARKEMLEWKVKSASFVYNFTGDNIYDYYMFLRSGYDLSNINMEKLTERRRKDEVESYKMFFKGKGRRKAESSLALDDTASKENPIKESLAIEVDLDYRKKKMVYYPCRYSVERLLTNRLQIKFKIKKKKMLEICKKYGVEDRDFALFMERVKEIDENLFRSYMKRIGGEGTYYRYDEAEKIIMASAYSKVQKKKMCDALKGIAGYKGISNYLNHVEDEEIRYECMASMRKREYAQVALRNLQKLGINPLNISIRNNTIQGNLKNLIDVYIEANPYELIKKSKEHVLTIESVTPMKAQQILAVEDGSTGIKEDDECPF